MLDFPTYTFKRLELIMEKSYTVHNVYDVEKEKKR